MYLFHLCFFPVLRCRRFSCSTLSVACLLMVRTCAWVRRRRFRFESDRLAWAEERGRLLSNVSELRGKVKALESLQDLLLRRMKMLEYALKKERMAHSGSASHPDLCVPCSLCFSFVLFFLIWALTPVPVSVSVPVPVSVPLPLPLPLPLPVLSAALCSPTPFASPAPPRTPKPQRVPCRPTARGCRRRCRRNAQAGKLCKLTCPNSGTTRQKLTRRCRTRLPLDPCLRFLRA